MEYHHYAVSSREGQRKGTLGVASIGPVLSPQEEGFLRGIFPSFEYVATDELAHAPRLGAVSVAEYGPSIEVQRTPRYTPKPIDFAMEQKTTVSLLLRTGERYEGRERQDLMAQRISDLVRPQGSWLVLCPREDFAGFIERLEQYLVLEKIGRMEIAPPPFDRPVRNN